MRRFLLRWFGAVALLPMLATCSPEPAASGDHAVSVAEAAAEARLIAFLIDGAR
jgi:hypothetical protein